MLTNDNTGKRTFILILALLFLVFFWGWGTAVAQESTPTATVNEPPAIDIWYGPYQVFGEIGTPQKWVNILGNVSDEDGISSLVYSLNLGPEIELSIGPDGKRLLFPGDFNIDISRGDLLEGINQVAIIATDTRGVKSSETVEIEYHNDNMWPFPYAVVWSLADNIQDVVQVVDGKWIIGPQSLRTAEVGYNRLVAIGDLVWTDYEILVPITVNEVRNGNENGGPPALGIQMRWTGHTEDKQNINEQPKSEWNRNVTTAWWHWEKTTKLEFDHGENEPFKPQIGVPYLFKLRVESAPDQSATYRLKAWEESQPEPDAWNLTHQTPASDPTNGSFLLLAHHVDATFGDLIIKGLAPLPTPTPLPSPTPSPTAIPTITPTPSATSTRAVEAAPAEETTAVSDSSFDTVVTNRPLAPIEQEVKAPSTDLTRLNILAIGMLALVLIGLAIIWRRLSS